MNDSMTEIEDTERYALSIDGIEVAEGTFGECLDELCKMRMHGCHFQDPGDAVVIRRVE